MLPLLLLLFLLLLFADDRQKLFSILSGQQQLPSQALRLDSSSSSSSGPAPSAAEHTAAARQVWEQAASKLKASWAAAGSSGGSSGAGDAWWVTGDGAAATVSYEEAEQTWQQLLVLAGQPDGPRFDQVLLSSSSSSRDDGLEQQLQQLQAALQRAFGLEQQQVQELAGVGSSTDSVGPGELSALQQLFAAPPTLEQVLQQRWQQVGGRTCVWRNIACRSRRIGAVCFGGLICALNWCTAWPAHLPYACCVCVCSGV